jgi:phage shock protein PspC (stress-responsive transcriptional regulator)
MNEKKLYRSCKNRIIGGVCGGLGEYFDIDPVLIRLIIALLFFTGVSIIFYLIAWIIIPEAPDYHKESKSKPENIATEVKKEPKNNDNDEGRLVLGVVIIVVGILLLLQNVLGVRVWEIFWPLILVSIGLYFLFKARK